MEISLILFNVVCNPDSIELGFFAFDNDLRKLVSSLFRIEAKLPCKVSCEMAKTYTTDYLLRAIINKNFKKRRVLFVKIKI